VLCVLSGAVVCRAAGAVTRQAASGLLQCRLAKVDPETRIRKLIFGLHTVHFSG
jgi:hypothetical protein